MKYVKRLLFAISKSTVLNWLVLIIFIVGLIFGFGKWFWIVVTFILWIENQLLAVNMTLNKSIGWTKEDQEHLEDWYKRYPD